jgi:hypothetical protein
VSAYDNDARVRAIAPGAYYEVEADDVYDVSGKNNGEWYVKPSLDSRAMAGVSREEGNRILESARRGPFASEDEAIKSLIGDPQ